MCHMFTRERTKNFRTYTFWCQSGRTDPCAPQVPGTRTLLLFFSSLFCCGSLLCSACSDTLLALIRMYALCTLCAVPCSCILYEVTGTTTTTTTTYGLCDIYDEYMIRVYTHGQIHNNLEACLCFLLTAETDSSTIVIRIRS